MSVRSWPSVHRSESVVHQTTRSEAGQSYVESTREDVNPVVPELRIHGEQTVNEKINRLFKTRIELMNTLTTTQGWKQENIYAGTTSEEITTRKKGYDECWRKLSMYMNSTLNYLCIKKKGRMHVIAIKSR